MQAIATAIGFILAKIGSALSWIGGLAAAAFIALYDLARDAVCWVLDQLLTLAISILSSFDFSGLSQHVGSWAGLPAGVLEVLAAIGLSTAVGIIVSAIGIRLLLQLVPFTRLGS